MYEIHEFARDYCGTYVIMVGPSATLRERLYSDKRLPGYEHFSGFNKSLFTFY
jgi:hypothetical protein